jgi:hypothetical protein
MYPKGDSKEMPDLVFLYRFPEDDYNDTLISP